MDYFDPPLLEGLEESENVNQELMAAVDDKELALRHSLHRSTVNGGHRRPRAVPTTLR